MTLERIRAWFNRLPEVQRDLPIVIYDGVAYTPRMILDEVQRATPLGARLQALVEAGRFGTTPTEEEALLKTRVRMILERMPPDKPVIATLGIPSKVYTPRDLISEVERQTETGRKLMEAEKEAMKVFLRMAR